jgi:hypothetical protein
MRVRRHALCALLAGVVASASSAAVAQPAPCSARGSVTLAASKTARIFSLPKRDRHGRSLNGDGSIAGRTWGCVYAANQRLALGTRGDRVLAGFKTVANYVAFVAYSSRGYATVRSSDLRTGRPGARARVPDAAHVTDLALARSGSLAWIEAGEPGNRIQKYEEGRGVATVDPGPHIFESSLAIGRNTFFGPERRPIATATLYWSVPAGPELAPPDFSAVAKSAPLR